jgi:TRAP-type C4-dicarboxylate transport system permease small subunit
MLVVIHLLVLAFLVIVLYGGIVYINLAKIQTTAVLRLSVGWMYAAAPVAMFLMILETFRKFFLLTRADNAQLFLDKDSKLQAGL